MSYCQKCKKEVNVIRNNVDIGIAECWQEHCEECNSFITSGINEVKDIVFDFSKGDCEVRFKDAKDEGLNKEDEI